MATSKTIEVLNAMQADGVIERYAIAGAVAAYYYIEPTVTEDLDVLISLDGSLNSRVPGLVTLEPIFSFLGKRDMCDWKERALSSRGGESSSFG